MQHFSKDLACTNFVFNLSTISKKFDKGSVIDLLNKRFVGRKNDIKILINQFLVLYK